MAEPSRLLWFRDAAPERAFTTVPEAGFCVSVFVFLRRGARLLLGRYAEHPRWVELSGLDPDRVRAYREGWTVPGRHLELGEHPREAGSSILADILGLDPDEVDLGPPRVETSWGPHPKFPEAGEHFDLWFFLEARAPEELTVPVPGWYEELGWRDPRRLRPGDYARCHGEVVAAFTKTSPPP